MCEWVLVYLWLLGALDKWVLYSSIDAPLRRDAPVVTALWCLAWPVVSTLRAEMG